MLDVSKFIEANIEAFPQVVRDNLSSIKEISRGLPKKRELAFYGLEDWITSEEYTLKEAWEAKNWAREIQFIMKKALDIE